MPRDGVRFRIQSTLLHSTCLLHEQHQQLRHHEHHQQHLNVKSATAPTVTGHMLAFPSGNFTAHHHVRTAFPPVMAQELRVICCGTQDTLNRPCVDCGRVTGSYCDRECDAKYRLPSECWEPNQKTPHCTHCDRLYGACHFCRGVHWTTPPSWEPK